MQVNDARANELQFLDREFHPANDLEKYGMRPVERLAKLGVLIRRTVLAHCVNLTKEELRMIAESGAGVAHNPMSNMLNAVGVAPVPEMLELGVLVGLGNHRRG